MPYHLDIDDPNIAEDITFPAPDFQDIGPFKGAVVTVNNLVARATTRWTLEESKLFMCAVSKIDTRNEEGWIRLPKSSLARTIGMDPKDSSKLRTKMKSVMRKSEISLEGPTADDWEEGLLMIGARSDRKNVYVRFDSYFMPLLQYMKGELFTRFDLSSILGFRHKSAYNLYLYLASWHDCRYTENKRNIPKSELSKVFNLKEGQYWRKYGTPEQKFDWPYFERRCLLPAIEDINGNPECDLFIDKWEKAKSPEDKKTVLGYQFIWHYTNPDGSYKIKGEKKKILKPDDEVEVLDYNHADRFMKHFRKLNDDQMCQLAKMLKFRLPDGDYYTVEELEELRKSRWTSQEFAVCLERSMNDDSGSFSETNTEKFEKLFGYQTNQPYSDIWTDLGSLQRVLENEKV